MVSIGSRHERAVRVLVLLALATLLSAVAPAAASAAVIGFDDLTPAPPPPGGHGTTVNVQYQSRGVTFNNPEAFTYPSGFAHSGQVGVEPCVAVEFCMAPVRADFTTPQNTAGAWVGFTSPLSDPLTVRLSAFDASNTQIATTSATLPANSVPTPIQTHLTVNPPGKTIAHIEVTTDGSTPGGGFNNGLAVDDVEFSTPGPPPVCTASGPPIVHITQPTGDLGVQNNAFTLAGSVDPNGGQITAAHFVANSATPHTASVFPVLIGTDGGPFGPISVNGLLSSGNNDVTVTATNCAGTGTSELRKINYSPIPAGARFQQLGMIDVNQTVQNTFGSVPLIAAAGPATIKRTMARVYLGLQGTPAITQVSGTLQARLPDGSPAPGPAQISSLNTMTVTSSNTAQSARASLAKSLNFELPSQWLAAGRIHLQLAHLSVEGQENHLPCDGCDNPFTGGVAPAMYRFHAVPPVRIWLVRVPYMPSPAATQVVPSQTDINMLASWLRRAYPTAEVRDTQMFMPVQSDHPEVKDSNGNVTSAGFKCNDINSRLRDWASSMQAQPANTRYYGVVSDNGGSMFMRGCSEVGGTYGSGPSGNPTNVGFNWDTDSSYADWYGGHEIGHLFGRRHPGYCNGNSHDDDHYPYAGGLIGGSLVNGILADNQGIDMGNSSLGLPMQVLDWRTGETDVMTYCDNEWMSDYTYEGILSSLCGHETQNCPDHAQLASASSSAASRRRALAHAKADKPRLVVNGSLSLKSGRLSLRPLLAMRGPALTDRPRHSTYSIVERGTGKRVLARYPFEPKALSDPPAAGKVAAVHEVVPFDRASRRIVVEKGGKVIALPAAFDVAMPVRTPSVATTRKRARRPPGSLRVSTR